ncbi:MAG: adenosylcobinamide-GDP ribazoletransferase [Acidilobaceae archaeon]
MRLSDMLSRRIEEFRSLITLLTTIPLGPGRLEDAARAFHLVPLIGLIVGVIVSSMLIVFKVLGVEPVLAGLLYVAIHTLVTGGLHLDGFADYSDVIGSRARGERALSILKDPRKGSFAVILVAINIIASYSSSIAIYESIRWDYLKFTILTSSVIVLSYIIAYEAMYLALFLGREEPYEGMAKVFSLEAKRRSIMDNLIPLAASMVIPVAGIAMVKPLVEALTATIIILTLMIAIVVYVVRDSSNRIGFINGDIAGFTYELVRVLGLVALAIMISL